MHRNILEAALSPEVRKVLHWVEAAPAQVVLDLPGKGDLADCATWPGLDGAAALVTAGFERLRDRQHMERLHAVGRALASEQNLGRLLDLILTHGRSLLLAEAGSIYLVTGAGEGRELVFAHTQNARVSLPYHRFQIPVSANFIAGFVALTAQTLNLPDVYQLPAEAPYRFNDSFDRQTSYRTTSMLVVPLQDTDGNVLGVLQFINRLEETPEGPRAVPFLREHEHLAQSLAGQAGVAMKNAKLREDIELLFESFVNASVTAIEQRDPVTSGHSGRVATLTVGLAEAMNSAAGVFQGVQFNDRQLREIRYASLLHDFGKVGVREQVLVKSKKLEPNRLEILLQRLRQRQDEELLAILRRDWEQGLPFDPQRWAQFTREHQAEADRLMGILIQSNEPTVLSQDVADGLGRFETLSYTRWDGQQETVIEPRDLACLSIRKGSLSEAERLEIESHVTHTYQFLSKIPWTADLAGVPAIAYAHHERLNGKGYPRRLTEPAIPLPSKAMAITDVFDALTAQDRPYKAALSLERSLAILEADARDGHLDPALLALFIEAKVYERTMI
jgi:HD-GYP domain-containing protein (c-di-GMP phosphodiesterase class II)